MHDNFTRYKFIAENTPDLICETSPDGVYTYLNSRYLAILGYSPGELLGRHFSEQLHPDDRTAVLAIFATKMVSGRPGEATFRHRHKDGTWRWLETLGQPMINADGENRAIFVSRDITARKEAEEKLAEERLKRARLESLAVLAGGIAHDFNNLLTTIMGHVTMAQTGSGEALASHLAGAEKACLRTRDIIAELTTFARGGNMPKTTVNLEDCIRRAGFAALAGKEIDCRLFLDPGLAPVLGIEPQLNRVIENILTNAVEAMDGKGIIEIDAQNLNATGSLPPGQYATVRITDHGPGVSDENRQRIFEPYFTTREGANGFGLATAHSIALDHGGSLDLDSKPGEGATFILRLPAMQAVAKKIAPEPATPAVRARSKPARILVMDDEASIRELISHMLANGGFTVESAAEGADAVRKHREALENGVPFDVVLLDLRVPKGMGGIEAFQVIRALEPGVKAIISSGYSEAPIMEKYLELGIAAVVPKPYSARDLIRTISSLL